jgi:hypothetical protein
MTKAMTKTEPTQLTIDNEDENILSAAKAEAGFERLLKFKMHILDPRGHCPSRHRVFGPCGGLDEGVDQVC